MLIVAQMLLLLFVFVAVIIVTWFFVNTDNVELTRLFSGLIILGLILVIIYRIFLMFGKLENWQKIILLFASIVNGAILFFILRMLFDLVYIQLG